MVNCSAVNCSNHTEQKIRLFRFPTDKKRRKIWVDNCKRAKWEPSVNSRLCEVHFDSSQWETKRQDNWVKLKPNAIPTLFNFSTPPEKLNLQHLQSCRSKCAASRISSEIISTLPDIQSSLNTLSISNSQMTPSFNSVIARSRHAAAGEIFIGSRLLDATRSTEALIFDASQITTTYDEIENITVSEKTPESIEPEYEPSSSSQDCEMRETLMV